MAGIGLLIAGAMFYLSVLGPLRQEVRALKKQSAVVPAKPTAEQIQQQPDRQLQTFYATFPKVKDAPDALEKLNDVAVTQGVNLAQGEYHLVRNGADKLARYEIALPIKTDYLHLRKFLSRLLADMPYVSLDSIEFQRQKISDATLDAQVKMTLFLVEH